VWQNKKKEKKIPTPRSSSVLLNVFICFDRFMFIFYPNKRFFSKMLNLSCSDFWGNSFSECGNLMSGTMPWHEERERSGTADRVLTRYYTVWFYT
jgi:hypothetical protein